MWSRLTLGLLFPCFLLGTLFCRGLELPDVSGIDRELTSNLSVDQFFSLWIVFNDDEVQISDKPFTILAPKNRADVSSELLLSHPEKVKTMLLDHMVLGQKLRLDDVTGVFHFKTLGGKIVGVNEINGTLYADEARVLNPRIDVPGGGVVVILEDYLVSPDKETAGTTTTTTMTPGSASWIENVPTTVFPEDSDSSSNSTFFQNLVDLLSFFKNGVRVFQHFLSRSNVSQSLKNDEEYTVLIPTDHAFQRWHPIDWGFYPFSVPEFTETVIVNHFIPGNLRQENIKDGQKVKTLGNREIVFTRNLFFLSANGAPIVRGDTPIHHGNLMFVSEVLFVSEAEVQKLHQQNKDKETPPLLAFPWFGAQFLSHAFLALERQRRFSHVTRFLNLADLAPRVSGKGYTFFVPTDEAFEKLGLGDVPDDYLSTGQGLELLLNHFVKGRLYERELVEGTRLLTLGNKTLVVSRKSDAIYVNDGKIIENEVFVYNLGTMFYIDKVLFTDKENLSPEPTEKRTEHTTTGTVPLPASAKPDAEKVPEELAEDIGTLPDVLLEQDVTTQPADFLSTVSEKITKPETTATTATATTTTTTTEAALVADTFHPISTTVTTESSEALETVTTLLR